EVVVVVHHGEPVLLGGGGDEQVADRHPAVVAPGTQLRLDLDGAVGARLGDGCSREQLAFEPDLVVVAYVTRGPQQLEVDYGAGRDPSADEHRLGACGDV